MNQDAVPLSVYEAEARSRTAPLRLLDYAGMSAMPEPQWLIEGILQCGSTAVMFGKSNSFKSFLAIDLGLSVASGCPWHGHEVIRGDVLFVATEGANGVGRRRIPAWYEHSQIRLEQRRAFLFPKEIRLDVPDEVSAVIAAVRTNGEFRLVVLDIFGGTMAGSEIEDKTARAWVHGIQRIVRETGASILTVAHTGWQDETRARMHTHFWGSFDTRLKVEGDKEALTAMVTVDRHKDADSSGSWGFRMSRSSGSLVPVLDAEVRSTRSRNLTRKLRVAMDALDHAIVAHGGFRTGTDWPAKTKIVTVEQWRTHFYRHSDGDTPDNKRQAFNRARSALREKGLIGFYDDCVWRCFE